jgi:mRNA-degrading endonuclease toxin of MazEF toxin-antitoxin module
VASRRRREIAASLKAFYGEGIEVDPAASAVVNVTQLLAIDTRDLVARVTFLSAKTMRLIDAGLRFALDL